MPFTLFLVSILYCLAWVRVVRLLYLPKYYVYYHVCDSRNLCSGLPESSLRSLPGATLWRGKFFGLAFIHKAGTTHDRTYVYRMVGIWIHSHFCGYSWGKGACSSGSDHECQRVCVYVSVRGSICCIRPGWQSAGQRKSNLGEAICCYVCRCHANFHNFALDYAQCI